MDDRGQMRRYEDSPRGEAEAKRDGFKHRIREDEYAYLENIPEARRPFELALRRFCEDRIKVGASVDVRLKNAFRLGWEAHKSNPAKADASE